MKISCMCTFRSGEWFLLLLILWGLWMCALCFLNNVSERVTVRTSNQVRFSALCHLHQCSLRQWWCCISAVYNSAACLRQRWIFMNFFKSTQHCIRYCCCCFCAVRDCANATSANSDTFLCQLRYKNVITTHYKKKYCWCWLGAGSDSTDAYLAMSKQR